MCTVVYSVAVDFDVHESVAEIDVGLKHQYNAAMVGINEAQDVLQQYFGYTNFRRGQEHVIRAILEGRDVLAVMPTGAGKSLCYQIPAMLLDGITVVISPLVSLMADQVEALHAIGIRAVAINSFQTPDQQALALSQLRNGRCKIVYVAPERLKNREFTRFLQNVHVGLFAVDEAHCVSQWGQDFRQAYLDIRETIAQITPRPRVAAFTATATERVRQDIISLVELQSPLVEVTSFERPNLYLDVEQANEAKKRKTIVSYVREHSIDSGIIYCFTRRETEQISEYLRAVGVNAQHYHAGLASEERVRVQQAFVNDEIRVIVATNAFGMGIDKSNVRFVIHHNMPSNLEEYYQEAGRAGRDGEPSYCMLLWNNKDIYFHQRLINEDFEANQLYPESAAQIRSNKQRLLNMMVSYARTTNCLHKYITGYFGQQIEGECPGCSNCDGKIDLQDVTSIAIQICHCVYETRGRIGKTKITQILRGATTKEMHNYPYYDRLESYGVLSSVPKSTILDVLNKMISDEYLSVADGQYPVIGLGRRAEEISDKTFSMVIKRVEQPTSRTSTSAGTVSSNSRTVPEDLTGDDKLLFEKLRQLRKKIADEKEVKAFVVFHDSVLIQMCKQRPTNYEQMLAISGVGQKKLQLYGNQFLDVIDEFRKA